MSKTSSGSEVRITAISGSPNKKGNTVALLEEALDVCARLGAKTKIIHCREALKGQKTPFCINCETPCTLKCAEGTNLEKAMETVRRSHGLIIGSPVYFGTVSGQLKAFWDKTRSLRYDKSLLNVPGGAVSVGGSPYGGQEATVRAIHEMMLVQGMILVGDGHAEHDCGHMGAMANRPSPDDRYALERVRILAKRIFQLAEATRQIQEGEK